MKTTITLKRIFRGIPRLYIALSLALLPGALSAVSTAAAGDAEIHAVLDQTEIGAGEQATLTVSVSGALAESPIIPRVDGLAIIPAGRSSRFESVNGRVTQSAEFLYTVQPSRTGKFTIPAIGLSGTAAAAGPLHLTVAGSMAGRAGRFASPQAGAAAAVHDADTSEPAFLKVYPAKDRLYVGEVVPVDIVAFFRQGISASIQAAPQLSDSAFSLTHATEKPRQTQETVNGERYTVLTWHEALCSLKEGAYPLASMLEVTMAMPEKRRRSPRSSLRGMFNDDDFFNDPFFDSFFSSMQEKEVRLASAGQTIQVRALPAQGCPVGFSGAIGRFTVEAAAKPHKVVVGDPLTLSLRVRGRGNFNRFALEGLADVDGWKTYAPSATFKPADTIGYEGVKQFEQAVIPKDASLHEIPPVSFSYFDPDAEKYVTVSTRPLAVQIDPARTAGSNGSASVVSQLPAKHSAGVGRQTKPVPNGGLAPVHIEFGSPVTSLRPVLYYPWFWGLQFAWLLLIAVGAYLGRRGQVPPGRERRIRHAVKKSVAEMDRSIAENDAPAFFNACRHAAQVSLGELWGIPPAAITFADIEHRLNGQGSGIRQVFETADAVAYSGRPLSQSDMRQCRDVLIDELGTLEKNHAENSHH